MSQATVSPDPYYNSNLFSGYYLDERISDLDEWEDGEGVEAVFEELRALYEREREVVEGQKEDALIDAWIDPVLETLGYGSRSEATLPGGGGYVDRLLFDSEEARREAEMEAMESSRDVLFKNASGLLEAKQWGASFSERFHEDRQYRDASHQVKFYLERTPEQVQWGILTNGRKWRLYGTKDYETQTFYEVDLPELLEAGDVDEFKYFYLFFRPEALREVSGSTFLDTVWNESETAAQELGEDLQDNVFTALRVLGKGFVETNELEIDPDDEETLDELKEQSLVLLYRLMFVLYAESRHLIDPDDPTAKQKYDENFSLDQKRLEILDTIDSGESFESAYSEYSTSIWQRLQDLFRLIDQGEDDLGIPPYNGGLFDTDEHEFLTDNRVADQYLAEVIYRLSTTEAEGGEFVPADYADLDTRHLGSIYEGLLEHEFRIAPEQYAAVSQDGGQVWKPATEVSVADAVETVPAGSLYVVNDEGERKATGAYYTPDYVVTYIVEETVDPLVEEIEADLAETALEPGTVEYVTEFWKRVKGLKILDPAMGSGHFLTKATGYLAEQVMAEVRELETATLFDEEQIRREVSKECIYGVDLNGMAVELAKLSMWLETLSADQPLAFLDHHLKAGNSLVGSDITEILSTSDGDGPSGQATLQDFLEQTRQQALEQVMDHMQDLLAIENDTLADIKEMERTYEAIREDPLFEHLLEMASVHTAGEFGLDVPDDADEQMAKALRDDSWDDVAETDWFRSAQALADDEQFFHWELEFPEVFFNGSGEVSEDAGFDAVVGNPPYVRQEQLKTVKPYLKGDFRVYHGVADLYTYFIETATELLRESGKFGQIISNKFTKADYGESLREFLTNSISIDEIIDFDDLPVFPEASAYPMIFLFTNHPTENQEVAVTRIESLEFENLRNIINEKSYKTANGGLSKTGWSLASKQINEVLTTISANTTRLEKYVDGEIHYGIKTGLNDAFFIDAKTKEELIDRDSRSEEIIKPLATGTDVRRYYVNSDDQYLIFTKQGVDIDKYPAVKDYLESYKEQLVPQPSGYAGDDWEGRKAGNYEWYEIQDRVEYSEKFEEEKILYPVIASEPRFAFDYEGYYANDKCFIIPIDDKELIGILNSSLTEFWVEAELSTLRGGYQEFRSVHVKEYPVTNSENDKLERCVEDMIGFIDKRKALNLSLHDHLGNYAEGKTLTEIGFTQPPAGSADSILNETTETRTKLQIERAKVEREGPTSVTVHLTARYKPDEEEEGHDLDSYGYTETEFQPALRISDLTETEADLIEAFVPVAIEEAGGFADFRDNATKTNSLMDRLKKLTLPKVEDVESGLKSYIETKERAEELDEKIEKTDDLIDQIVYELYGLTDEEIEIVENAVGE